ncbi:lactamase-like protein nscB [Colletotrichum liriopes]|uniref:Lactamase-like protein nscB n=1 Tax=Colletotrichum liriopes TaxID=708192 RepID=A0AA37GXQ1_9PEZI|nr:lactamase-like protein nscB [Colletotrichum liriopes]
MPSALATLNECIWGDYLEAQQGRLGPLPEIEHLNPRVVRIMGGNSGLLRPPGFRAWIDSLLRVLEDLDVELSRVILIHWHK